jgi:WD40 repeat protein
MESFLLQEIKKALFMLIKSKPNLFYALSRNIKSKLCFSTIFSVVNSLQFGFDNISLASCSDDLSIKLWKFDNDSPVINIENAHNDYVKKILFLENNLLASGGYDKLIKIWDLRAQEKVKFIYLFEFIILGNNHI